MTWTRMAGSLALVYAALAVFLLLEQATSARALRTVREKQIKLEDIERDNLQTELLKQQRVEHHAQHQPQHHPQQEEGEQGFTPSHYHPQPQPQQQQQQHFRYEPASLHHHAHHHQPQQHHQHQQQLLLQAAAQAQAAQTAPSAQGLVPTHVMYLIMPNGNVAAFQLAPHPNQIPAYYTPSGKAHLGHSHGTLGTLYHQHVPAAAAAVPSLQFYQPQPAHLAQLTQPQVQYIPGQLGPHGSGPHGQHGHQRYHPAVHHQPTLSFNSAQAHQLHAQHFRDLAPLAGDPSLAAGPLSPEVSSYSQPQEQQPLSSLQSHKSLFGAGVKATAAPPLKGSFSTQTGQSYTNFRQYG